jgi:methionyl-tRNA formyltransferase
MYKKNIAFYLMTNKGYWILKEFVRNFTSSPIEVVIIGQDKNIENDYFDEIKQFCIDNQILYFDRYSEYEVKSECVFTISWRWLINNIGKRIIVLHDSLLPKYRGFAPLVNMLINGEKEIGVTALFASDDYDCGDIIAQKSVTINYPITIDNAIKLITPLYSELINTIVKNYLLDMSIIGMKQNDEDATYSLWRDEQDYFINWNDTASNIKRFIDAVGYPYKGACTLMNKNLVRIRNATIVNDLNIENRDAGKVVLFLNNNPVVVCREGLLQLNEIVDDNNNLILVKKFRCRFR